MASIVLMELGYILQAMLNLSATREGVLIYLCGKSGGDRVLLFLSFY